MARYFWVFLAGCVCCLAVAAQPQELPVDIQAGTEGVVALDTPLVRTMGSQLVVNVRTVNLGMTEITGIGFLLRGLDEFDNPIWGSIRYFESSDIPSHTEQTFSLDWSGTEALVQATAKMDVMVTQIDYGKNMEVSGLSDFFSSKAYAPAAPVESFSDEQGKEIGKSAHGRRVGAWSGRYEGGQLWYKGGYVSGKREGKWTWWYPNGNIMMEGFFKAGMKDGRWTIFYPSGKKYRTGLRRNGVSYGLSQTWYENGNLKFSGYFENSWAQGKLSFYYENGKLRSTRDFQDQGVVVNEHFDNMGVLRARNKTTMKNPDFSEMERFDAGGNLAAKGDAFSDLREGTCWAFYYPKKGKLVSVNIPYPYLRTKGLTCEQKIDPDPPDTNSVPLYQASKNPEIKVKKKQPPKWMIEDVKRRQREGK